MRRFIEFVVRYKNYIALCTLVVMSFSFMSFGALSQLGGFRAVVVGSIGWIQSLFAWVPNPVALKSENTALRELNLQLSIESSRFRQSMVENATLRKMLDLQPLTTEKLIAADIVGKTTTELRNYATINKGTEDGIKEGMTCITDAGLVGNIVGASPHFAVVQLLLNRDTRVAAKVYRTRVDGIVHWQGETTLSLKDVPRTYDVKQGDLIITSSYSAKYPPNVVVGTVQRVDNEPNSLFQNVVIESAVNFATLEQVFVLDRLANEERATLEGEVTTKTK
jgi:rod shape-determining protein MreC